LGYEISGDGSIRVRKTSNVEDSNIPPNTCAPDITKRNNLHVARENDSNNTKLLGYAGRQLAGGNVNPKYNRTP
jgi:hypothetical protein